MEESNYNRGGGGAGRGRGGGSGSGRGGSGGGRGGSGGGRGGSRGGRGGSGQQYHQGQYQTGGGGNSHQLHNQGQIQSGGYGGRGGRGSGRSGTQMWTNPPTAQPRGDQPVQVGQGGTHMGTNPPPAQSLGYRPVQVGQGGTQRPVSSMGQGARTTGGRGVWSGGPPYVTGRGSWASAVGAGAGQAHRTDPVPAPDSVTSDMKSLQISDSPPRSLATSSENRLMPMKRPDRGGVVYVSSTRLLVNHFPVAFNSQSTILHYNVDVKQEDTLGGRSTKKSIPKSVLNLIREKLFSDSNWEFHLQKTAYDSEKSIFSAVKLPTGSFKVELSDGEDTKIRIYTVTIDLVKELQLSKLKDYLAGNLMSMPRDILQGMDLVMKENPSRHRITVGRSTYPREFRREDDLRCGVAAFKGFQQSLKPTSQGLALCLDYSVLAFRKRMPVIDFLTEHLWGYGFKGVNDIVRLKRDVLDALKGLKINVTHRVTKQKYTIVGLTDQNTRNLLFTLEDPEGKDPPREVTLVNYFREKYGKDILYKDIPCLDVGKNNKKNYVPLEFCTLVEGQRYPKDNLDKDAARLLKNISLAPPVERMNTILKMVRAEDAPCGGDIIKNFEIGVDKNMTSVVGRIIGPPDLKLATPAGNTEVVKVDERCQWNLTKKSVVEGRPVERWALIDFTSSERYERLNPENFVRNLRRRCERLGIHMAEPLAFQATGMHVFNDVNRLRELLQHVIEVASRKTKVRLQIVLCVMARKHPGYKSLKFVSETQIGVVTQCCLLQLANEGKDQNLANLALKINAKLGGSNVELIERLPRFEGNDPVMFVGADVNHPGALNATCPSIAAVVASINWPAVTQYAARVCPQNHRKEKIVNFGPMCLELVNTFARHNEVKPKKIVVFRDGVSESQFDMVLNEELQDLKMAIYEENYRPTITLVVAQKRHHTRLFLENQGRDVRRNISPGTVVDTKIVHPFEYDFYLCSHYGNLGTSKPTHYYVLYDEHNFTSDQLQKLIYQLCFTFARCTKPVSLVPPVYYADLVAFRGRMFQEVLMEMQFPPSASSSTSFTSTSSSSAPSFDDAFYKLHSELQNIMFFI